MRILADIAQFLQRPFGTHAQKNKGLTGQVKPKDSYSVIVNGYTYRTNPHNVATEGGPLMIDIPWWVNERGRLVVGNSVIINGEEYVRKSLDTE